MARSAHFLRAAEVISGALHLEDLLRRLMQVVLAEAGAQRGVLLLQESGSWSVQAVGSVEQDEVAVRQGIPLEEAGSGDLPLLHPGIVQLVLRTGESIDHKTDPRRRATEASPAGT